MLDIHVRGAKENYCVGVMMANRAPYRFAIGRAETITFTRETADRAKRSYSVVYQGELSILVQEPTSYICVFSPEEQRVKGSPSADYERDAPPELLAQLKPSMQFQEIEGGQAIEFLDEKRGRKNTKNTIAVLEPGSKHSISSPFDSKKYVTLTSGNCQVKIGWQTREFALSLQTGAPARFAHFEIPPGKTAMIEVLGEKTASYLCEETKLQAVDDLRKRVRRRTAQSVAVSPEGGR